MFKNVAIKDEKPDTSINADVKIEIEDSFLYSDLLMSGSKSEDNLGPSDKIPTILPIETIDVQQVSALFQPMIFLLDGFYQSYAKILENYCVFFAYFYNNKDK